METAYLTFSAIFKNISIKIFVTYYNYEWHFFAPDEHIFNHVARNKAGVQNGIICIELWYLMIAGKYFQKEEHGFDNIWKRKKMGKRHKNENKNCETVGTKKVKKS